MGPQATFDVATSLHLRACAMGHSAGWPRGLERGPRVGSMNPDTKLGSAGSSQLEGKGLACGSSSSPLHVYIKLVPPVAQHIFVNILKTS